MSSCNTIPSTRLSQEPWHRVTSYFMWADYSSKLYTWTCYTRQPQTHTYMRVRVRMHVPSRAGSPWKWYRMLGMSWHPSSGSRQLASEGQWGVLPGLHLFQRPPCGTWACGGNSHRKQCLTTPLLPCEDIWRTTWKGGTTVRSIRAKTSYWERLLKGQGNPQKSKI